MLVDPRGIRGLMDHGHAELKSEYQPTRLASELKIGRSWFLEPWAQLAILMLSFCNFKCAGATSSIVENAKVAKTPVEFQSSHLKDQGFLAPWCFQV